MVYDDINFNPKTDIQPVVEGLDIDLNVAVQTGVVFDTGSIGEYNDIEDVSSVGSRVRDAFEALDAQKRILAKGKISPNEPVTVVNSGESGGV